MRMIKEIRLFKVRESITMIDVPAHCIIRTNYYGMSVAKVKVLAEAAKESFPAIKDEDIEIVQYGGDCYAGTFGVEFDCPDPRCSVAPNGWRSIHELERTK